MKEYGKQEMNMNTVESSPVYCIHVAKAGIDKSLPAHAKLSIIDQEELNKTYGLMDNIDYRIIPKETYSFSVSTTDLEFQSQEGSKEVNVTFHSDLIYEEMKKNEGVQYVLPIRLHSEKDSVDVLKNDILLLVDVKQPQITFKKEEVHSTMKFKNVDVQLEANLRNILSKWDFTCSLSDDNKEVLVNEYNKQHGTGYLPMPSTAYELPNLVFKKGINEANLTIPVSRTPLESDRNYLLPLKIQSISLTGFAVSDEVCYLSLNNPKYIATVALGVSYFAIVTKKMLLGAVVEMAVALVCYLTTTFIRTGMPIMKLPMMIIKIRNNFRVHGISLIRLW